MAEPFSPNQTCMKFFLGIGLAITIVNPTMTPQGVEQAKKRKAAV
jgi:hypothetical protein